MKIAEFMRHDALNQVSRIFLVVLLVTLAGMAWVVAQALGFGLPDASDLPRQALVGAAWDQQVALISGHAGNDSGMTNGWKDCARRC